METNEKELINLYSTNIKIGQLDMRVKFATTNLNHLQNRLKKWKIHDIDRVILIAKEGVAKFLKNNLRPNNETIVIVDKQTCICIPCVVSYHRKHSYETVYLKTVFKFDGTSRLPNNGVFFVNEDNPSEEFSENERMADWYGDTWTNGGSANDERPTEFVGKNYNWRPNARKSEILGEPLTTKGYKKLGDAENMNVYGTFYDKLFKTIRGSEANIRRKNMEDDFNENEREKIWDKVRLAKTLYDTDKGPILGINQDLRDVDDVRNKAYQKFLDAVDKGPIPGINQNLRDSDNTHKKQSNNESIKISLDDLKYIVNESVKIIKKRLS